MNKIAAPPLNQAILAKHTKYDSSLSPLVKALVTGDDLEQAAFYKNELTLSEGCIFWGSWDIIPQILQKEILKELYIGHVGMTKIKAIARSYLCVLKNMDADKDNMVRERKRCN